MRSNEKPEKYEVMIWDATGEHPTGPGIVRFTQSGQISVGGMQAEVAGLDEEKQCVILGWDVETSNGWEHCEISIRYDQYYHLLYGPTFATESHIACLEARVLLQQHAQQDISQLSQKLKDLDDLYYVSYKQDEGRHYDQVRQCVESRVRPLGYTVSHAECCNAGAGVNQFNYSAIRHVLVPLPA